MLVLVVDCTLLYIYENQLYITGYD